MDADNNTKQQLAAAVKARQQLEVTYESQFQIRTQFVSRLSLVCKGIDVELDNKLARLRQDLNRGTDLEKLLPQLDATTEQLKQIEVKQTLDVKKAQYSISEAGKLLQKQKGLPNQLRRDLRELLSKVEEPAPSLQAFIPHLTDLTALYQTALSAKQDMDLQEISDSTRYDAICRQISIELTNLLSELAFEGKHARAIENIRLSLLAELTIERLLEACLRTIEIIISSINEERQSAQHFLLKLNEALTSVQQSLISSQQNSNSIKEKMQLLNQQIEHQISVLGKETQTATSLEQLQVLVTGKLGAITNSLQQKELLERQEREMLMLAVKEMEMRLRELEAEAAQFKKRLAEQKFRSLQDALTELPNRAAFDERFELELKRWKRYDKPLSIVLADVDHFKNINDSFGHSAGDKTLKVIARALRQSLRDTDFIARYGGEEFILLFPETAVHELEGPLNSLREKIKRIPFKFKDQNVPITISFGATQLRPSDTGREAFDRADEALYDAKREGRDKVMFKK